MSEKRWLKQTFLKFALYNVHCAEKITHSDPEANYKMSLGNDLFSQSYVPLCWNGPEIKTNGHKRRFRLIHWQNWSPVNNCCVIMSPEEGRSCERYCKEMGFSYLRFFLQFVFFSYCKCKIHQFEFRIAVFPYSYPLLLYCWNKR